MKKNGVGNVSITNTVSVVLCVVAKYYYEFL